MNFSLDRLKKAFDQAVAAVVTEIDYHALYTFQVVKQNGDGTLELQPVGKSATSKWASMSNVPIRYGIPGAKITVKTNAQVLVGFRDGDPAQRFAALWATGNAGDLATIEIDASDTITLNAPKVAIGKNAILAAARKTDTVKVTIPAGTVIVSVTPGPPAAGVPNPTPIDLVGTITAGSSEVTIG